MWKSAEISYLQISDNWDTGAWTHRWIHWVKHLQLECQCQDSVDTLTIGTLCLLNQDGFTLPIHSQLIEEAFCKSLSDVGNSLHEMFSWPTNAMDSALGTKSQNIFKSFFALFRISLVNCKHTAFQKPHYHWYANNLRYLDSLFYEYLETDISFIKGEVRRNKFIDSKFWWDCFKLSTNSSLVDSDSISLLAEWDCSLIFSIVQISYFG